MTYVRYLLVVSLLAWSSSTLANWENLSPGVDYMQRVDPGPNRVSVLRIRLCTSGIRMRASTYEERSRRTSTWASARNTEIGFFGGSMVGAINGGYFLSGGAPDGGRAAGNSVEWPNSTDTNYRGYAGFGLHQVEVSPAGLVEPSLPGWVDEAVNGDATLVEGGRAVVCNCGTTRAPRTAIGYTADRKTVYLVAVDGRSSSSIGMTIDQLAQLMAGFGVDRAMNLDGGGSTTMWVNGRGVVNRPSDGSERVVGNSLGIFQFALGEQRHCPEGYSSEFVGGGFAGGGTVGQVEVGTEAEVTLRFKNTGTFGWNGSTTLAPIPRDAPSPLAGGDWIAPHRITSAGAVASGATGTFTFRVKAPNTPGTTRQYLNLVQEGETWFQESWGPNDNVYWIEVEAVPPPAWRGELVASSGLTLTPAPGETVALSAELRNTGSETWPANTVKLATTGPRDRMSALRAPSWLSGGRLAANATAVAPGESYVFDFDFTAPDVPGRYDETFGLVAEDITWFGDAGGPADDMLRVQMTVALPGSDTGGEDSSPGIDSTGADGSDATLSEPPVFLPDGGSGEPDEDTATPPGLEAGEPGCGCRVSPDAPRGGGFFIVLAMVLGMGAIRRE